MLYEVITHISCALDMRVPENRRTAVAELLAVANEKLWIGHLSLWAEEGLPMFRYSLLLGPELSLSAERLESLIDVAVRVDGGAHQGTGLERAQRGRAADTRGIETYNFV